MVSAKNFWGKADLDTKKSFNRYGRCKGETYESFVCC